MMCLEFYNKLESMNGEEYIKNFLIYNTSLVIAKIKPAVTVTFKKNNENLYNNWCYIGKQFIKSIGLNFVELRESNDLIIVLIYNHRVLEKYIGEEDNKEFLGSIGYSDNTTVIEYLNMLKNRYKKYNCPHELGIFLGIPLNDVKDFMNCDDKKCLLCGYWKVYNDCISAKRIFESYDHVKEYTIESIFKGIDGNALVQSIENNFNFYG
jgi:hypothetical protein